MPLLNDPDSLNQGIEITLDTTAKTITLNIAGNLSNDGVTGQCLYSFLKEEWKNDASLPPIDFPMSARHEEFEFVENWKLIDDTSRNLLRSGGWKEISDTGELLREYAGVIQLGNIDAGDTAYYRFSSQASATSFSFDGVVNQGVQTFGNAANGSFDYRQEVLTVYLRVQGKLYASQTTTDIDVSVLANRAYRFPLSESTDTKLVDAQYSDANISTQLPYTGMSITYGAITRTIGGVGYNFSVLIEGNDGTAEQIYAFVQYQLRQDADIDAGAGTENGLLAETLVNFVNDDLFTNLTTVGGVYIDNFNSNDNDRVTFLDDGGEERTFPFVSAGTISFNEALQSDPDAEFWMFYTTNPAGNMGTSSAVLVNDNSGTPIAGSVGGLAVISFDFDYDGNAQGGRTVGTNADVTIISIGLDLAEHIIAKGTITRAAGLTFSLAAPSERNYLNPA
jgi:hypothetical protein